LRCSGGLIATGGDDNTVRLWPAGTEAERVYWLALTDVAVALGRIGLQMYSAAFDAAGYLDLESLQRMYASQRAEVAKATGMKHGHARKFEKYGLDASAPSYHSYSRWSNDAGASLQTLPLPGKARDMGEIWGRYGRYHAAAAGQGARPSAQ